MAITGYFIDVNWRYREVLLGFEHLQGTHTGESLAGVLEGVLKRHDISDRILAITTDNASNNNTLTKYLQHALGLGSFCAKHGHLLCLAYVIQLLLKELFGSIRIIPDNEEIMTVWDELFLDMVKLKHRIM